MNDLERLASKKNNKCTQLTTVVVSCCCFLDINVDLYFKSILLINLRLCFAMTKSQNRAG